MNEKKIEENITKKQMKQTDNNDNKSDPFQ